MCWNGSLYQHEADNTPASVPDGWPCSTLDGSGRPGLLIMAWFWNPLESGQAHR